MRRVALIVGSVLGLVMLLTVGVAVWGWLELRGSLPALEGTMVVEGLTAPVRIDRDERGIPTISAASRVDAALATGFVHAQDRFFQMDLMRRNAAGELAELAGAALVDQDRRVRVHRFRARAAQVVAHATNSQRQLLEAYARGVNAGLDALSSVPFEYRLLGSRPAPWQPEDSVLVMFTMYLDLQGSDYHDEAAYGLLRDTLSEPLYVFVAPRGTQWDAPLEGEAIEVPPVPGPDLLDLRRADAEQAGQPLVAPNAAALAGRHRNLVEGVSPRHAERSLAGGPLPPGFRPGSNNWAVAGRHTTHGGAIVADDMHLSINVPPVWYRAALVWREVAASASDPTVEATHDDAADDVLAANADAPDDAAPRDNAPHDAAPHDAAPHDAAPHDTAPHDAVADAPAAVPTTGVERRISGVMLPGTPAVVVGSNGYVAWGFTNAEGDFSDLVVLEHPDGDTDLYLTPEGPRPFTYHRERIVVKDGEDVELAVIETIWGPVVDRDHQGRSRTLRWVAYDPEGVNMGLLELESVRTLEAALDRANRCGQPAQNFVVADNRGQIAWTIIGPIPRRVGFDGFTPTSWADGTCRWDGWLAPEEYPRIVNPPSGRIWTANARVVSGEQLAILGDGGYDLGARASQIRDNLLARETVSERDMLDIQLDDRAVFLERWRQLLLDLLTPEVVADHPLRAEARELIDNWGGRAAVDSVGYRLVRDFRQMAVSMSLAPLIEPSRTIDPYFNVLALEMSEGPAWRLVSERPPHLLEPAYETWEAQLLLWFDAVLAAATEGGTPLAAYTWGSHNTTRIQHPLSAAVPALARWLDMPCEPLPGDTADMPRIQGPAVGASERMAVSPGREEEGYLHVPGGQSGHPLSPHYRDGHEDWTRGRPSAFLPGQAVNTLLLVPAA